MPMGNEIHYAVAGLDNIKALLGKLGLQVVNLDDEILDPATLESMNDFYMLHEDAVLEDINRRLEAAYFAVAERLGWKYMGFGAYPYNKTHHFETPFGLRRVSQFHLEYQYDPDEAGDDEDMASLGVALSGRYVPTFLDIESPHGALYSVDLMDALEMSKSAIEEIVREVPELADMRLLLREIFY